MIFLCSNEFNNTNISVSVGTQLSIVQSQLNEALNPISCTYRPSVRPDVGFKSGPIFTNVAQK